MDPPFFCRVFRRVVLNAICFGFIAPFIYSLVRLARRKPRNISSIVLVSLFLIVSVCFCAWMYSTFYRLLWNDDDDDASASQQRYVVQRQQGHAMNALHQEPPVRDWARVVAVDDIPSYKQQRDAGRQDCAVCLDKVEEGETVKRLPVCLHMRQLKSLLYYPDHKQAMGCMSRLMDLAFATTVCIGGTALLLHLVVEVARRRSGTTALIGLSGMLFFWILTSVLVLPCFCAELVPWSAIKRCLRGAGRQRHAKGGDDVAAAGRRAARVRRMSGQGGGGGDDSEEAASVPARVPPAVHRPVASGPLINLPCLPVQRFSATAGADGLMVFFFPLLTVTS
ncbi:hypothetical protein PR202_ga07048 [Eleusine coracana subsp. coracana]|uniref:RING-type E3 ubiquitin transferase n=1 Tax=Eleusine coracana subsp. coracana TaxID=191504 RepID=A0AAV5BYL8_ELECO|nr:hypothetical protein PR202_ga07048 [Eleusine coracana subsp. coracana]